MNVNEKLYKQALRELEMLWNDTYTTGIGWYIGPILQRFRDAERSGEDGAAVLTGRFGNDPPSAA